MSAVTPEVVPGAIAEDEFGQVLETWPDLVITIAPASTVSCVPAARTKVARHLEHHPSGVQTDRVARAGAIVDELLTNAVVHHALPAVVSVMVYRIADRVDVVLRVYDAAPDRWPRLPALSPSGSESGHGLRLVDENALRWSACPVADCPRIKCVWAMV